MMDNAREKDQLVVVHERVANSVSLLVAKCLTVGLQWYRHM